MTDHYTDSTFVMADSNVTASALEAAVEDARAATQAAEQRVLQGREEMAGICLAHRQEAVRAMLQGIEHVDAARRADLLAADEATAKQQMVDDPKAKKQKV